MLTLLVSDLHLSPLRPATARLFQRFLAGPARAAGRLYVLGDLFDYWIGDDDVADPFNEAICRGLADTAAAGTEVFFLRGNRDFLVGGGFAAAAGLRLIEEPAVAEIAGMPTLLLHGDTLCSDDLAYQKFRATVRTPDWQRQFLARPLAERRAEVETLRMRSEVAKQDKSEQLMDTNADAVAAAFREHRVHRMIHGHTHRQACHRRLVDGHDCERWVLGQWGDAGNALACDENGCRWLAISD